MTARRLNLIPKSPLAVTPRITLLRAVVPGAVAREPAAGEPEMPVERFKSAEAERKNLAFRHMNGIPYTATSAVVGGHEHKVKHSKKSSRKRIDARQRAKKRG